MINFQNNLTNPFPLVNHSAGTPEFGVIAKRSSKTGKNRRSFGSRIKNAGFRFCS
jgi:hypothetical protein